MHLQCTMSPIFDWEVRRFGHARHVKTRNDKGLRIGIFSQKLPFSVWKKMFQRQILEVQYTIPIRQITNISDFVWFQRSCGSMKSVSSFSSIDLAIWKILYYLKLKQFSISGKYTLSHESWHLEVNRGVVAQHNTSSGDRLGPVFFGIWWDYNKKYGSYYIFQIINFYNFIKKNI